MLVLHVLLVVRVDPLGLRVGSVHCLLHKVVLLDGPEISLHFSVVQYLLAALLLELHGVELVLLFLLVAHHFGLSYLHFALEINLIDLVLVQALEVVWFDAVRGEHAHLCLRILSHEIVIIGKLKLMVLLLVPKFAL